MTDPCSSSTIDKKRVFIHRQARELANRILEKCVEEKKNQFLTFPLNNAFDRASHYTGISKRTLAAIQKQAKTGPLSSPSTKGKSHNKKNNLNVDDFDRSVIHRTIEEFYLTKKVVPTCPKLLTAVREKISFPWGLTSLRKLLKAMGYKWQKCHNKGRILVERPAVVYARSDYLRTIRRYRQEERNIFFLGESNRFILVHAGSRAGFLNGGKLLFKAGTATDDYHGQMNQTNFEKWTTEMLIPNLPPSSVVVMENTPYHSVQENKVPMKTSTKPVMLEWLIKNNVEASTSMRKDELFRLIETHKPSEKTFKIDEHITSHGHIVVRLPPYMCDLNPIELAWAKVKRIKREDNDKSDLSLTRLREVTELAITQVTEEDWRGFDDHVIVLEEHYWQRDGLMEDAVDRFVTEVGDDSDDSDSDSAASLISVKVEIDDD